MAERLWSVELTANFEARLDDIESFLEEAGAGFAFDQLLQELRDTVVPHLKRFARLGRPYLDQAPQSAEALTQLAALPTGAPDALREYLHSDYLILYTLAGDPEVVYLLSIRHHRQLTFDFAKIWSSGAPGAKH